MNAKKRGILIAVLVMVLWQPLAPIRNVTATILHTAADLIAR